MRAGHLGTHFRNASPSASASQYTSMRIGGFRMRAPFFLNALKSGTSALPRASAAWGE